MLAAIVVCSVVAALPILFGVFRKLRGKMVVMGNNSLAISASCHPVPLAGTAAVIGDDRAVRSPLPGHMTTDDGSLEKAALIVMGETDFFSGMFKDKYEGIELEDRIALSQGKLKWGAVRASNETGMEQGRTVVGTMAGRLAFAGEDEAVNPPQEGKRYQ